MRTTRFGQFGGAACANAVRASALAVSADAANDPAKRRRVITGSTSQVILHGVVVADAKLSARHAPRLRYVQERLQPRAKSDNPRSRVLCARPLGFQLFRLSLRDRRKVIVTMNRRFAQVLAAVEQEYSHRDRDQRAEDGAQSPVRCPVASHHDLR